MAKNTLQNPVRVEVTQNGQKIEHYKEQKIKIIKEKEKTVEFLQNLQKPYKKRVVEYDDLLQIIKKTENWLENRLYKKDWLGVRVHADPHRQGQVAGWHYDSSGVVLQYTREGWVLCDLQRGPAWPDAIRWANPESYELALGQFRKKYTVVD